MALRLSRRPVPAAVSAMIRALALYRSEDLGQLAAIGSAIRKRKHGSSAFYIINRHINYSNICVLDCDFLRIRKNANGMRGAYELTLAEMVERGARLARDGRDGDPHRGGAASDLEVFPFTSRCCARLRELDPAYSIKAFTAIEILHFTWVARLPLEEVLVQLRDAGLSCLTGGGAEIFADEVRRQICRGKETGEEWLEVHRTAHRLGIRSTATMLFGHVESYEDRVDHLRKLRGLQDETGGFLAFLPLAFKPAHRLSHLFGSERGRDSQERGGVPRISR